MFIHITIYIFSVKSVCQIAFSPDIIYIANESLFDICEILSSLIM